MVRAIFLDIDGTLRDERLGVPESAVQALGLCRETGIQILLCTGRNMASIQPDVRALYVDGIIAGGGCLILEGDRVQRNLHFQYEEIEDFMNILMKKKMPFSLETQEQVYMNEAASLWFKNDFEKKLKGLPPQEKERQRTANGICYRDNLKEYRPQWDAVHKICIWASPGEAALMTAAAEKAGTIVQQGEQNSRWYLEILPRGCTKGEAVRAWCRTKDISLKDTISFGDGKNDLDMLLTTGIAIAMADGDRELKSCADSICEPASQDGIYRELVRRKLIKGTLSTKQTHREERK